MPQNCHDYVDLWQKVAFQMHFKPIKQFQILYNAKIPKIILT